MKITGIEIKQYHFPFDPPFLAAWDPNPRRGLSAAVVLVRTDEGLTGVGSGTFMEGFSGCEELFIGRDPFDLERHWQILDNIDFHAGRCWPLDLALWDLVGKAAGRPVYQMLGGGRNKILAYASTGEAVPAGIRAERTAALAEEGFKAVKIRLDRNNPWAGIEAVEAVRLQHGEDLTVMVDANQGWRMPWDTAPAWDLKTALRVAEELEELGVYWLEEPLPCHDFEGLARLREMTGLRIAGGEMNRRWPEFREMSRRGCLDVYQPDAALSGGITGVKKTAEMVQAAGAWFSPHTWTNGLGLLANLHLALAISLCPYLEFPYDPPGWTLERRDFLLPDAGRLFIDREGCLAAPDKPGLGLDLDFKALSRWEVGRIRMGG